MITGADLKQLVDMGVQPRITAIRLSGTAYGVVANIDGKAPPQGVAEPGSDNILRFDSLDEVASFLSQIGIKGFQVDLKG